MIMVTVAVACGAPAGATDPPPACSNDSCPGGQKCDINLGCVQCTINADCSRPVPLCVPGLGRCGECLTNADCGASTPVCWPSDHNCHMACKTNADCPSQGSHICQISNGLGACVGCRPGWATTDCPLQVCNPVSQQCVGCMSDTDCPQDHPRCSASQGECVQCEANNDCASGAVCDLNNFTCRSGCTSDSQCGGNTPICNMATFTCVQCTGNGDCNGTLRICGPGSKCVQCLANTDCPSATPVCHSDACAVQ